MIAELPCFITACQRYKVWYTFGRSALWHSAAAVLDLQQMSCRQSWPCHCLRITAITLPGRDTLGDISLTKVSPVSTFYTNDLNLRALNTHAVLRNNTKNRCFAGSVLWSRHAELNCDNSLVVWELLGELLLFVGSQINCYFTNCLCTGCESNSCFDRVIDRIGHDDGGLAHGSRRRVAHTPTPATRYHCATRKQSSSKHASTILARGIVVPSVSPVLSGAC